MDVIANSGIWGSMFGVPCVVADNFLKIADDGKIKVLLYILRNSGKTLTTEDISANTGVDNEKTEEAVLFWKQVNVLSSEPSVIRTANTGVDTEKTEESVLFRKQANALPSDSSIIRTAPAMPQKTAENISNNTKPVDISPLKRTVLPSSEISSIIRSDKNIAELFKIAETHLGILNNSMQNSLIWMYNYLGMKKEVIITLICYCVQIDKRSASYIEKVASDWTEREINTLESATAEVVRLNSVHTFTNEIKRMFELVRTPTSKQREFISQWQTAGYSLELIHCAYEKTVEQINKVSFEYINKILLSWKENGYKTPGDVKNAKNENRKNKPDNSDGYDAEKYKILINNV